MSRLLQNKLFVVDNDDSFLDEGVHVIVSCRSPSMHGVGAQQVMKAQTTTMEDVKARDRIRFMRFLIDIRSKFSCWRPETRYHSMHQQHHKLVQV